MYGWDWWRKVRMLLSILFIIASWWNKDFALGAAGFFLFFHTLFNLCSACSSGSGGSCNR